MKNPLMGIRWLTALGIALAASGCAPENQTRGDASSPSWAVVESFADVDLWALSDEQRRPLMAHLPVVLGEKAKVPFLITKLSDLDQKELLSIVWDAGSGKVPSPCIARLVVLAGPGKVVSDTTFGCADHHGWIKGMSRNVPAELGRSALIIQSQATSTGEMTQVLALIRGKPALVRLQDAKGAFPNWYDDRGAAMFGHYDLGVNRVEGASVILRQGDVSEQLALLVALGGDSSNPDAPTCVLRRAAPIQELLKTLKSSPNAWVRDQARLCLEPSRWDEEPR